MGEKMNANTKVVILAAGKGKRMESENPKVLHEVRGKHMIRHLLEEVEKFSIEKPIVVVGYKGELVRKELGEGAIYVEQTEQLGTAHAVAAARIAARDAKHILVLQGDQPFVSAVTLLGLLRAHTESGAKITLATSELPNFDDWRSAFTAYGRILRSNDTLLIREYRDATTLEKGIKEVNAGVYVFEAKWLWENLGKIGNQNAQKEYYLTDLLRLGSEEGVKIETVAIDPEEALGANSKEELEILEKFA